MPLHVFWPAQLALPWPAQADLPLQELLAQYGPAAAGFAASAAAAAGAAAALSAAAGAAAPPAAGAAPCASKDDERTKLETVEATSEPKVLFFKATSTKMRVGCLSPIRWTTNAKLKRR